MVRCDKCEIEIPYLPFRCKYCGKYFCRDHRLPENHDCSGRFNAPIVVVPTNVQKEMGMEIEEQAQKHARKRLYQDVGENGRSLRRRETWFSSPRWRRFQNSKFGQYMVTHIFLILFVIGCILSVTPAAQYVLLNAGSFFFQFYFHTIITAVFVPEIGGSYFGIIFVGVMLYVFYRIGKQLEMLFGRKFLIIFVFTCGILTGAVYLVAVLLFSLIPGYGGILTLDMSIGTNYGIFMGIAVFFAVLMPQQTMKLMFPPIQLKAKTIAIVFIAISVGMGFISWAAYAFEPDASLFMCDGLANLGGVLGGYLIAKYGRARFPPRPPYVQFASQY